MMNAALPSSRRSGGFTLVELVIVCAVLAIIAMAAAPSFAGFLAQQSLRGAANEALSDLQFARAEAVQRNAQLTVRFNSSGYTITSGATTVKAVTLDGGNSVSSGNTAVVVFDPVRATATVTDGPAVFANTSVSGTVRANVSTLGRVQLCSPSGAIKGFASCG